MNFTELHHHIKSRFNPLEEETLIEETGVAIRYLKFQSRIDSSHPDRIKLLNMRKVVQGGDVDERIIQNTEFVYPAFIPPGKTINDKGIILLHGLNERKYDKYLAWGHYLAEKTGKTVLLFPISFHLNRGMPEWIDPRELTKKVEARKSQGAGAEEYSSFVNLTLSERLNESPERFFLSGLQTAIDLNLLLSKINEGQHPLFTKGTTTDFFAYSIGGLLAQVMFLADEKGLLKDSKLFLFCAGSMFTNMYGVSKVIMDKSAFEKIHHFYREGLIKTIRKQKEFAVFFHQSKIGKAFRAMIRPDRFRRYRESFFRKRAKHIYAISLKNDKVIPPNAISKTLLGEDEKYPNNMEVFDFNYPYTHEMPFPVKKENIKEAVNKAFEQVFFRAACFLT